MRFAGNFPKENITYDNSVSDALKVVVLAVVPGTDLPLRDGEGKVVTTFKATDGLIHGAISSFRGGVFNTDHEAIPETMIGVYDSVIYDAGFKVSGSILCPIWKEKIISGNFSGVSIQGDITGEMENPDSMKIQAISFLSNEKSPAGGACPLVDSEGNPVCKVEIIVDEPESVEASKPIIIDNNIQGEHMTKKEDLKIKAEASVAEIIPVVEVETPEIVASVPEAVVEAAVVNTDTPAVPATVIEVPAPVAVEKTLDWSLVSQELGIKSKDEFTLIKDAAGKIPSLEEKIDGILKENESLKSFKIETEKKWLESVYPQGVVKDIAAAHAEFTRDPAGFVQKYAEDAYKFKAAASVKLQGSAAESELTEEAKKMQARKDKRDKFLNATGGPAVR
jgi:hypothetical protein